MSAHTFRVVWPLDDPDQQMKDVVEVALGDLPDLLFEASVQQTAPMKFEVEFTDNAFQLVGECPVEPWTDTVRKIRRRPVHT